MRLHLLDPQLYAAEGHFVAYDTAVVEEFRRRGVETNIYGAVRRKATIEQSLVAEAVFSRDIFDEVGKDDATWALQTFTQLNGQFREDLTAIVPGRFSRADLAFFPNLVHNQLDGLRQWIRQLPETRRPTVAVKLSFLMHEMIYIKTRPHHGMIVPMFRAGIRQLVAAHPRTVICSDTEEMVEAFSVLSGVPVTLLPLPMAMEPGGASEPAPADPAAPPRIVFLGNAIPRKGFQLLPEIIRRVTAATPAQFTVQFFGGHPPAVDRIQRELGQFPPQLVTVIRGTVDAKTYARLVHQADIVLFPYFREFYRWASSGVCAEAMSLGKVTVAPADTWIARQIAKYDSGGVVFPETEVEPIAAAVIQACTELPQRRARAQAVAEAFRREHSPASFVDKLLAAVHGVELPSAAAAAR